MMKPTTLYAKLKQDKKKAKAANDQRNYMSQSSFFTLQSTFRLTRKIFKR